jgi:amino acid adenylation domain-containing protein
VTIAELLAELESLDVRLDAEDGRLRISAPKGRLTPQLQAELVARKDELLRTLSRDSGGRANGAGPLTAITRNGVGLPLSFFQERLWVIDRLTPGETAYSIATLIRPADAVDLSSMTEAIRRVVARHEILRSRYLLEDAGPVVRIGRAEDVPIITTDLRAMSADEREATLAGAADVAAHTPYDLGAQPPVRFTLFRIDDDHAALLIAAHHIAVDAWSFGVLFRELQSEYVAVTQGRAPAQNPAIQYVDFAAWQRRAMEHSSAADRLAYWKRRLAGLPQLSTFPADAADGSQRSGRGTTVDFTFAPDVHVGIRTLARQNNATIYMVLLAGMAAVLSRHTGQTDLALGSPVGTRAFAELENVIGPVVNPLVMRFDLGDDPTFAQLIDRAREAVLDGHENQDVPFERIVHELNPERSLGHSPLFQVAVVLHNAPQAGTVLIEGGAIYDLTLFTAERGDTLGGAVEYRSDLYERATVERILQHLEHLLAGAAAEPHRPASQLSMLGADERARLGQFNAKPQDVDRATVVEQFATSAQARASSVAVVSGDESVTYGELEQRASALASRLQAAGVRRGDFVGLAVDRSSALPIATLAILQAGAAYVPLDLDYPAERVRFMLSDSGVRHVVTTRALASQVSAFGVAVATVFADETSTERASVDAGAAPRATDPAYLLYTSGSTGQPKGVVVPHSAISNLLGGLRTTVDFTADDAIVAVTSPAFDISVLELFLPLVQGGRVVIASRDVATDGAKLAKLIDASGATMFQSTPSGWRLLVNAGWRGNGQLCAITGGEPMTRELADWLLAHAGVVWNCYGPTETTVYSTASRVRASDRITIGRPIANTRVLVVGAGDALAPIGGVGEICIAGDGVATGYHRRDELTAAKFVASIDGAGRMYRTGDIGRWLADGTLEHLGRADGQIKLRGYRIETGEIESALATHAAVSATVVGVRGAHADDQRLVAWVQFRDDEDATTSELRRHLRQRLPEFMIPSLIVPVALIPLTPNGKVDRQALPDPFASSHSTRGEAIAPSTPTELVIAEVWSRLLKVPEISVNDSFFELGGHSLLAMRAAAEIADATHQPVDPRLLFFRTLGQIAAACDAGAAVTSVDRR